MGTIHRIDILKDPLDQLAELYQLAQDDAQNTTYSMPNRQDYLQYANVLLEAFVKLHAYVYGTRELFNVRSSAEPVPVITVEACQLADLLKRYANTGSEEPIHIVQHNGLIKAFLMDSNTPVTDIYTSSIL